MNAEWQQILNGWSMPSIWLFTFMLSMATGWHKQYRYKHKFKYSTMMCSDMLNMVVVMVSVMMIMVEEMEKVMNCCEQSCLALSENMQSPFNSFLLISASISIWKSRHLHKTWQNHKKREYFALHRPKIMQSQFTSAQHHYGSKET